MYLTEYISLRTIKISLRALGMHRVRTALSTIGILFGVAAMTAMLAIGEGAKKEALEQIGQLGINTVIIRQKELTDEQLIKAIQSHSQGLNLSDVTMLATLPKVRRVVPLKAVQATVRGIPEHVHPEILAVTREFADLKGIIMQEGRFITDLDFKERKLVCVLGKDLAAALGFAGHLRKTLLIDGSPFLIVGISSSNGSQRKGKAISHRNLNQALFIPIGSHHVLNRRLSLGGDPLTEIYVQAENGAVVQPVAAHVKKLLSRLHGKTDDYQIVIPRELLDQVQKTQRTFNMVLGSIAAISLLVGGIGIMNAMLASISERIREIGIRRACGASSEHILIQFLLETFILTTIGSLLGLLGGFFLAQIISFLAGWPIVMHAWLLLLALGMALGVGFAAGLYPAIKAARLHPVEALRFF